MLENHQLNTIIDIIKLARRTEAPHLGPRPHYNRKTCTCGPCHEDRH